MFERRMRRCWEPREEPRGLENKQVGCLHGRQLDSLSRWAQPAGGTYLCVSQVLSGREAAFTESLLGTKGHPGESPGGVPISPSSPRTTGPRDGLPGRLCRMTNGSHDPASAGVPASSPTFPQLLPHRCQAWGCPGPNQSGPLQRLPRGSEHRLQSDDTLQCPALLAPNRPEPFMNTKAN